MGSALIGATGFVGGNLLRQRSFDDTYRSSNIHEIVGKRYEMIVCAGMPAEKWRANQEPDRDLDRLNHLVAHLSRAHADRLILISTIDVYPHPRDVDEDTPIHPEAGQPYGQHRLRLERFAQDHFPTSIIRLPGLFGRGLRKNVIFDLLQRKPVLVSPDSRHQYYDLELLWADIERVVKLEIPLVNFATEPVEISRIMRECFGIFGAAEAESSAHAVYDVRTRYDITLGGSGGYLIDAAAVLRRLTAFVANAGWRRP